MSITSCLLSAGYSLNCRSVGGIREAYIGTFSGATTYTYNSTNQVTGSTLTPIYYKFLQRTEQGGFTQEGGHDPFGNGSNLWTQQVELMLQNYDITMRDLIYVLGQTEVSIIVLSNSGKYFLIGEENGANLTASNPGVGKAMTDLNGSMITFQAKEFKPAAECTAAYIATLTIN